MTCHCILEKHNKNQIFLYKHFRAFQVPKSPNLARKVPIWVTILAYFESCDFLKFYNFNHVYFSIYNFKLYDIY